MIKNFLEPFYENGELERQNKLYDLIIETDQLIKKLTTRKKELTSQISSLRNSDLELGENDQERQNRLNDLQNQLKKIETDTDVLHKQNKISIYEVNTIELKIRGRYLKQRGDSGILQDCLDLIKGLEKDDVIKGMELESLATLTESDENGQKMTDTVVFDLDTIRLTDTVKFGFIIKNRIVDLYLDYFSDARTIFKIYKKIYDRTLELYPSGLTDKDKKNRYCIFDQNFFKALKTYNDDVSRREYENEILSEYEPEKIGHIIPSSKKIISTMYALDYISSQPHQITVDEYLANKKANDLVTFKGLDDDGLQFVFNENVSGKDTVLVSFKNLENASGGGTAPSKVFIMVLEKMNNLGYFHHKVGDGEQAVTISVKELISTGAYANPTSSKRALTKARTTLKEVLINFSNKKTGLDVDVPWFSSIGWKGKTTLLVNPNKDINWLMIGEHLAIYPPYIYKLNTHAYKLAYYIFTQARINKPIGENGEITFNIKLTTISRELDLPSVDSVSNYDVKKLILDKIIMAMKELTDADRDYYGKENARLVLKLKQSQNQTARETIENASLTITFKKSELTEAYKKIRDSKTDLIEAQKRKKRKIDREKSENQ